MDIVCFLFDDINPLDLVGPSDVLTNLPGARMRFVGKERGCVQSSGGPGLRVDATLDEVSGADLLLVPGGFGARKLQYDRATLDWLVAVDRTTQLTATVCTGSLLLAATGLLRGKRATTHWAFMDDLARHGAEPVKERVVRDGKYATAAGVSAGIDLALTIALELHGRERAQAIQLGIEYDPAPPLDAGNPARVDEALRARVFAAMHARDAEVNALAAAQRDGQQARA